MDLGKFTSVKSELSWVNLPTAGIFWEQSRSGIQMINLLQVEQSRFG